MRQIIVTATVTAAMVLTGVGTGSAGTPTVTENARAEAFERSLPDGKGYNCTCEFPAYDIQTDTEYLATWAGQLKAVLLRTRNFAPGATAYHSGYGEVCEIPSWTGGYIQDAATLHTCLTGISQVQKQK